MGIGEPYACRVCGYRGADADSGAFEICPCCFTQRGVEDQSLAVVRKRRAEWVAAGRQWWDPQERHPSWDPDQAFQNIPSEWR